MRKSILLFTGVLAFSTILSAQAYEGNIQYDKKKQQAILIDYSFPPEAVENAIVEKFSSMGYKAKEEKGIFNKDKGFMIFKNAYVTEINNDRMDYVVKVERKSRKESDESVLYMIMYKEDENAMTKMAAVDVGKAKMFLNGLLPGVEAANLELQIKDQQDKVSKAEKKLKDLKDDQSGLEKKLQDNKSTQEATQKDLEEQKKTLDILVGKRKKG